jgi:lysozyme
MKLVISEKEKTSILEQYLGQVPKKNEYPFDFSKKLENSVEDAVSFIKKHEGFCDGSKPCPPHTIGYGTRTDFYPELKGKKIDDAIATAYVKKDLEKQVIPTIKNFIKTPLTSNQISAISSLIYNIGPERFKKSELLKDLNVKNWDGVKKNWSEFILSNGEVLKGLVKRRQEEIKLFFNKINQF